MADATRVAAHAAPLPDDDRIAAAERFTRERLLHPGEDRAVALAPGTARRRALDRALRELEDGHTVPSTKFRRRYSLLLGLERVLSQDEPRLADGTLLNPHQVDALSGTLAALLTLNQGTEHGASAATSAAPVLAVEERPAPAPEPLPLPEAEADEEPEEDEDDLDLDEDDDDDADRPALAPADDEDDEDEPVPVAEVALPEEDEEPDESAHYEDEDDDDLDEDLVEGAADDPNADKRFWFEHATGAGKTVAAMGFVDATRTGGVLILTHRRNLVDQFEDELRTRGYGERISEPLLGSEHNDRAADGPVTVETYQWFVRNAGRISPVYTVVICDEAHTALGEKTSQTIRDWTGPVFIGMTATGALIARHVTDLFPTQTSRFDLAQAARRGVIAPLRCIRIPPGVNVKTIANVPLRRGDVDVEFDQDMLAELLDQLPFNLAIADLYKTRFNGVPGVIYAAGVRHAYNVAEALRTQDIKAEAVSGETPKRELASILAAYERGDIDVLVNAQLLAEGWNSPRATVCLHLAPTASKRIYQQRVGRVTRRHPGKEAGVVVDFVAPQTRNDDPVVTLHSLLDRDVYRGGAIVVGPVRRGRGRRVRVERRVVPVAHEEERRHEVFERELWRIAVDHLEWGEQHMWAALAGARVAPTGWRRARAMLHFDRTGELKTRFLLTAVERNTSAQLRLRALQEIAASRDPEAFQASVDVVGSWSRDEQREGVKVLLQALAEKRIGRRDQANQWIWDLADMTREVHEEYAVQRWPETKRLLGLLVNSSGGAHARNARRLVHASRKQDRRLSAALLAASVAHTPEAMEVIRGARTRMARKPSSLSRELLRNFPKAGGRRGRRRKKKGLEDGIPQTPEAIAAAALAASQAGSAETGGSAAEPEAYVADAAEQVAAAAAALGGRRNGGGGGGGGQGGGGEREPGSGRSRSRRSRRRGGRAARAAAAAERAAKAAAGEGEERPVEAEAAAPAEAPEPATVAVAEATPEVEPVVEAPKRAPRRRAAPKAEAAAEAVEDPPVEKPKRAPRKKAAPKVEAGAEAVEAVAEVVEEPAKPKRAPRKKAAPKVEAEVVEAAVAEEAPKPKPKRAPRKKAAPKAVEAAEAVEAVVAEEPAKPKRAPRKKAAPKAAAPADEADAEPAPKPKRAPRRKPAAVADAPADEERSDERSDEPAAA